jgi:hypothetical protein
MKKNMKPPSAMPPVPGQVVGSGLGILIPGTKKRIWVDSYQALELGFNLLAFAMSDDRFQRKLHEIILELEAKS